MYNAVRTVIQPCPVRDIPVGRLDILPADVIEGTDNFPLVIQTDIAIAALNIIVDQILRWPVGRSPLVGITMLRHVIPGESIDLHHPVKILLCGISDHHKIIFSFLTFGG